MNSKFRGRKIKLPSRETRANFQKIQLSYLVGLKNKTEHPTLKKMRKGDSHVRLASKRPEPLRANHACAPAKGARSAHAFSAKPASRKSGACALPSPCPPRRTRLEEGGGGARSIEAPLKAAAKWRLPRPSLRRP